MLAPSQLSQLNQQNNALTLAQQPMPEADRRRKEQMQEAWRAFRGEFKPPLIVVQNQPDDNVISNRCAPIVEKGTSFLFGNILKVECVDESTDDTTGADSSPMQDYLDGFWGDDDDKMTTLAKMSMNASICGMNFVKIIPPQGNMKYPRIVVLDPCLVRVVSPPDDCELVIAFILEYPGTNDIQKKQIISRVDPDGLASIAGDYDLDDTWQIRNYIRKQQGQWFQVGEVEEWPYPFAPIFYNQNLPNPNELWGRPDLTPDLIEANKVLNFVQSNISRIIKFHGHPVTYATGLDASQIQLSVDSMICLPSPESKIEKLAPMDNFAGLLAFVEDIRSNMDEQSRVPAVALGRLAELPKGNISGVALQLLFQPLIEKTVQRQRLFGRVIREISRAALVIGGQLDISEYEDYNIEVHYPNLLPVDDLAAAQTALILQQLQVSTSTILQQLGYSPDDEADKKAKEDADKLVKYSQGRGLPPSPSSMQADQTGQGQTASGTSPGSSVSSGNGTSSQGGNAANA